MGGLNTQIFPLRTPLHGWWVTWAWEDVLCRFAWPVCNVCPRCCIMSRGGYPALHQRHSAQRPVCRSTCSHCVSDVHKSRCHIARIVLHYCINNSKSTAALYTLTANVAVLSDDGRHTGTPVINK